MSYKTRLSLLTGLAAIIAAGGVVSARTDAETLAIVQKFNKDAFGGGDRAAIANEMADDFYEHHPTGANAPKEATKAEFLARMGKPMGPPPSGPGAQKAPAAMPAPPQPFLTLVSGDYVTFVTKQQSPDPTAAGKTYEQVIFDLFKVNAEGKISDHWDSWTVSAMPAGGAPPAP